MHRLYSSNHMYPGFNPNTLYFVPSGSQGGPWNDPQQSTMAATSQFDGLTGPQLVPSVAPSTSMADHNSDGVRWWDNETRILLSVWRDRFPELKNKRNTAKIWAEIAKELNRRLEKAGETLFRKGEQCKRRIKNLENEYKVVMDEKGRSGNGGKDFEDEFEYFDIFNELLGSNHDITPKNIIEGRGNTSSPESLLVDTTTGSEESRDEEEEKKPPKSSKGKGLHPAQAADTSGKWKTTHS